MAQISSYTTTETIRACLGIDAEDCPDEMIVNSNLELELQVDLGEWLPDHATVYSDGSGSGATAAQKMQKTYLLLYAQWYCAAELAARFLLVPQIVTDGKAQMNRFSKIDLEKVAEKASARRGRYRQLLDEAVNGASDPAASSKLMAISTPAYDPVTNT